MSERAAAADIEAGRLVRVLAAWTPPFPGLRLFHPSNRLARAALRAFIGIVRASTADRGTPRQGGAGQERVGRATAPESTVSPGISSQVTTPVLGALTM
ncbi:hypothetical protein BE21_11110 [Sorangium cellulosum]|uniref:LysR substrate-binding domain-containing protein n=1 Tax=Sorangium cellulosum TaxID=56 RepID=A0A150U150_SORCE|nr:hypothetical protein BE21_11110 [Sorangium cellulosum]